MARSCPVCEQRELLLWYAAGAVSEEDRKLVEEALSSCPECRAAFSIDRVLASTARRMRSEGVSPEELVRLSTAPSSDLSTLTDEDREIVSILRAVDAEQAQLEVTGLRAVRRFWETVKDSLGLGAWSTHPVRAAWAYLVILAMAYPAYLGLFSRGAEGPRILTEPVVLGEPSRTGPSGMGNVSEVGIARAGTDAVLTLFVPVDPTYHYRMVIQNESGAIVFRDEEAKPFDSAGTFAVLLPAGSFPPGRYEIQLEETSPTESLSNRYRFFFDLESDPGEARGERERARE